MTIPVRYISRHKSDGRPVLEGFVVAKIWSREADRLQAVLAARHGCNVSKRVLACPIDKINDFPRQFGSANRYRPRSGKRV
ncbi:hypothetical protein Y032_0580g264 [Ancylostoma ceylanicum]|uniref:Uncharacterized protein n=1 Tax=Ancylostoma ceylanicum TaxID=53326 RepID=A0A016WQ82_9BILA|nr:hypothetical protein Y032_0580g264 [Ancylostoma ceylanicum]